MTRVSKEKILTITWRNENYGRINDASAFRAELEPYPSDSEDRKIARIYKKNGYKFDESRCSWIAEFKSKDTPSMLVDSLTAAGYKVVNRGAQPDVLIKTENEAGVETSPSLKL